jgi:hypothetical protein
MLTNQIKGGIILAAVSICKNLLDIFLFKDKKEWPTLSWEGKNLIL